MPSTRFQRRTLLTGIGAAALLGTGSLSACSTKSSKQTNTSELNQAVRLPTYVQYDGATPDLPGTVEGVEPAFRKFPQKRPSAVAEVPGSGERVTAMANIYFAVPPGPDKNSYWAGLNRRMGVDLDLRMVGNADYAQKFATTIAGNDLPDLLQMQIVSNFPSLLEKRFTRLDEHLGGDAIKEYPNLANLPTRSWQSTVYNGAIYGVPIPRGAISTYNYIRQDLFEDAGVSPEPKGYDELIETGKALTNPKRRRWAYGLINQPRQLLGRMNGEPNVWADDGGKLTHVYETEQYKQTLNDLITMWSSGVIHPDAFSPVQPFKQLFNSGAVAINAADGYVGWTGYILANEDDPRFKLGLMPAYNRDGSALAAWNLGNGIYSMTGLKLQDDPAKIKLALRVLNYLAAPFGTEEYMYRLYGKEGTDHTVSSTGDPVLTTTGSANTLVPVRFLSDAPNALYQPGHPQDAERQHAYQSLEIPTGISNPTLGLFSNTMATKNATAEVAFSSGINDIIQGRTPFAGVDDVVDAWRRTAGDGMRTEYQDQMQGG